MAKGKVPCDNCGGKHYAPDFPNPRDEANINMAKEDLVTLSGSGGSGVGGCGRFQSD